MTKKHFLPRLIFLSSANLFAQTGARDPRPFYFLIGK
jgi:hypothetical protein